MTTDTVAALRDAALRQPGARERGSDKIKFQCPGCRAEGHDAHQDNAVLFPDGRYGCALNTEHRTSIGVALNARPSRIRTRATTLAGDDTNLARSDDQALTDLGNTRRLVLAHGTDLRYVNAFKNWLVWTGTHWQPDETGEAERRAKAVIWALTRQAAALPDPDQRARFLKHALQSQSARAITAMVRLARTEPEMVVTPAQLDPDPFLLACANGTLDLRTGILAPARRTDLITKCVPVSFDADAAAPRWEVFLDQIFAGYTSLIAFVQRAVGYALTGDTRERVLFVFYGDGANGKTTFVNAVMRALGPYAGTMAPDTLLLRSGDTTLAKNDLATLQGVRFVDASEPEAGRSLAEGFVKALTGRDPMKAKTLYRDVYAIVPTFKVFLKTNHKPPIRETKRAIWDRLKLIPFDVTIPEGEQDRGLAEALAAEAPGILAWAVRGCLNWQQEGLGVPDEVRQATAAWQREGDPVGRFLHERCLPGGEVGAQALFRAFDAWATESGEESLSIKALKTALLERGLVQKVKTAGAFWQGWQLKPDGVNGGSWRDSQESPHERVRRGFRRNATISHQPPSPRALPRPGTSTPPLRGNRTRVKAGNPSSRSVAIRQDVGPVGYTELDMSMFPMEDKTPGAP